MRKSMNLKAMLERACPPVDATSEKKTPDAVTLGDEIVVNDGNEKREGVVKVPNGPGDTVGVLIDGELEMIHDDEIERQRTDETDEDTEDCDDCDDSAVLEEGIMGMTMMPSLARMQELAGIRSESFDFEKKAGDEEVSEETTEETEEEDCEGEECADEQEDETEVEVVVAAEPSAETVEAPAEEPASPPAFLTKDTSEGPDVAANHPATAGEVTMMSAPVEPEPMPGPAEEAPATPLQTCLDAVAQLEQNIANVSVGEFNDLRKRIEGITSSLFEGVTGRQKKA